MAARKATAKRAPATRASKAKLPKTSQAADTKPSTDAERFVDQYLIDYDYRAAAIRMGVPRLAARNKGYALLQSADVVVLLQKRIDQMSPSQIATPSRIAAALLETSASVFAKPSERVAALKELRALVADAEASGANINKHGIGGVMLVPQVPGKSFAEQMTNWESAAIAMQRKLKDEVRD
jgi:hypothetical protein